MEAKCITNTDTLDTGTYLVDSKHIARGTSAVLQLFCVLIHKPDDEDVFGTIDKHYLVSVLGNNSLSLCHKCRMLSAAVELMLCLGCR